jgi:hypothetical protein
VAVNTPELPVVTKGIALVRISVGADAPRVKVAMEPELLAVIGVIVPPTVIIPLVSVKVAELFVPPPLLLLLIIRFPLILKVERVVNIVVVAVLVGVTTVPTLTFVQDNVPAPPSVIALLVVAILFTVMSPDNARDVAAFTVIPEPVPVKVTEAHAEFTGTVTTWVWIFTISPARGNIPDATAPPPDVKDHVVLAFQLPVAIDQKVVPCTVIERLLKLVDPEPFVAITV